jgi:hypothetical protein
MHLTKFSGSRKKMQKNIFFINYHFKTTEYIISCTKKD